MQIQIRRIRRLNRTEYRAEKKNNLKIINLSRRRIEGTTRISRLNNRHEGKQKREEKKRKKKNDLEEEALTGRILFSVGAFSMHTQLRGIMNASLATRCTVDGCSYPATITARN